MFDLKIYAGKNIEILICLQKIQHWLPLTIWSKDQFIGSTYCLCLKSEEYWCDKLTLYVLVIDQLTLQNNIHVLYGLSFKMGMIKIIIIAKDL